MKLNIPDELIKDVGSVERDPIADLIHIAYLDTPNIKLLLQDAYKRGLTDGKELTKKKIIEAITLEK